ncbi:hypothetical protein ACHAXR_003551 [Thalassiosira sp. AJA248-18]
MPVSGKKIELINRLLGRSVAAAEKVEPWKKSKAKALLSKLIADENSRAHQMTAEEIYKSHPWFQLYPLKNFKTNIKTLQKATSELKKIVREDEREIWSELVAFPRPELTCRGYPFWHIHPARKLLEKDVTDGKADQMKPKGRVSKIPRTCVLPSRTSGEKKTE